MGTLALERQSLRAHRIYVLPMWSSARRLAAVDKKHARLAVTERVFSVRLAGSPCRMGLAIAYALSTNPLHSRRI